MRNIIRLTENDLHKIVENTLQQVLKEYGDSPKGQKKLGRLCARKNQEDVFWTDPIRRTPEAQEIFNYAKKQNGGRPSKQFQNGERNYR